MNRFLHFLAYHNAVPVALGILFMGAGGALAASPAVQQSFYNTTQVVQSIDNTRIASADVASLPLSVQVIGVTEDADTYYLAYSLTTIALVNGVWQDTAEPKTLSVAKSILARTGADLGIYASEQLAQVRDAERQRLTETQKLEVKNGITAKVVATAYGGLVGKLFDPTTETFPGYVAVMTPKEDERPQGMSAPAGNSVSENDSASQAPDPQPTVETPPGSPAPTPTATAPTLSILGNNPARIEKGSTYADLGVLVTDDTMPNIGYTTTLDGVVVDTITIDTSTVQTHSIVYSATNTAGMTTTATRTVEVYDPSPVAPPTEDATTTPEVVPPDTPLTPPPVAEETPSATATTTP